MNVKARDVEAGKGSAKTNVASADDVEERGDPSLAMSIVSGIWFLGSLALAVLGFWYLSESGYTPPPIPVGHVVANVITIPGAALSLSSLSSLAAVHGAAGCTPANRGHAARSSFGLLWGLGIVAFGYVRFWSAHPSTLPGCPCPVLSAKIDGVCVPCPGYAAGECDTEDCVCGTEGTCSERTAQCVCEPNWRLGVNGTCSECSDRAMDGAAGPCTRCSERWKTDANGDCSLCRNGYAGEGCKVCHPNFAPRTDFVDGVETVLLAEDGAQICTPVNGCKDDQPADGGRFGPMCELVPDDKLCALHGDVNAVVAKPNNKLVLPATFTTSGEACSYDFECDSYNCLGFCAYGKGGPRQGALCREDTDCLGGVCESRTCGVEYRVGEDDCQCSRSGYLAPRCEKCPGFNGVWSASVCGGRGTCAAKYYDDGAGYLNVYSHLECLCAQPAGVLAGEFPRWRGEKCQRAVDAEGQTARRQVEGVEQFWCAEGFFGPECDLTCPSTKESDTWGGAGACDSRGKCVYDESHPDPAERGPKCACDQDSRPGGVGFFAGESCSACWQNYYGLNCQTCPGLKVIGSGTACDAYPEWIIPFSNNCFNACFDGQCDWGKEGTGVCTYPPAPSLPDSPSESS